MPSGGARRMRARGTMAALLVCAGPAAARAQQRGMDVREYVVSVTLRPPDSLIEASATIRVQHGRSGDTLRLDLVGMVVDEVVEAASRRRLPAVYDGRVLSIVLPAPSPAGTMISVRYRGTPRDGLIFRNNARGRISYFGDNWPNRARFWLPTIDHPADKALFRLSVNAPAWMRVVAAGRLVRVDSAEGRAVWRFDQDTPIPTYTMVLGATEMTRSTHRPLVHGRDTIPVEVWAYPEDSAFADSVPFRRATAILGVMERLVGPYPYDVLRHVQSSTRYGGMENSTAIFYAENGYVRRTMGEGVVRHETAHQWFGDAVTPATWGDIWLSEGFASYFDGVIGAALDGDSVLARIMRGNTDAVLAAVVVRARPVLDTAETDPNRLLNANSYPKGAWVLHMLRGQIGDSAFFRGIREYYRRYRDSSVTTEQFRRVMERAAGAELGEFFDQWLRRPGYPELEITFEGDSVTRHATLRVRQAQPAAWGRWRLEVPITFVLPGGRLERRVLSLDPQYESQVASYTLPAVPTELVVDPDGTLLLRLTVRGAGQ